MSSANPGGYAYSDATPHKQRGLRHTINKHASICGAIYCKHKWARPPYVFVDMNAGPGVDPEGNPGSPLIAAEILSGRIYDWRVLAFERSMTDCAALESRAAEHRNITVFNEDNGEVVDRIMNVANPDRCFGLVYHDPSNAPAVNWQLLRQVSRSFPTFDILINLACASYKRCVDHDGYIPIEEGLANIGKDVWLIRPPAYKHQWAMFLGTNYYDYREYSDFVRLDTKRGREILRVASMTKREMDGEDQLPLL